MSQLNNSSYAVKKASTLCSKNSKSQFFVAFEGRHLSKSSVKEVSEVNSKFIAT